jgi:hypothetical protein
MDPRAARPGMSPAQRMLRAKLAAHSLHAKIADRSQHTAPARRAFLDRFEREVDPNGELTPDVRRRRAEHARKAYFARLALASARARAGRQARAQN